MRDLIFALRASVFTVLCRPLHGRALVIRHTALRDTFIAAAVAAYFLPALARPVIAARSSLISMFVLVHHYRYFMREIRRIQNIINDSWNFTGRK